MYCAFEMGKVTLESFDLPQSGVDWEVWARMEMQMD